MRQQRREHRHGNTFIERKTTRKQAIDLIVDGDALDAPMEGKLASSIICFFVSDSASIRPNEWSSLDS